MLESAMSHISRPVDWEVYNIPPIQPVQYYSILKKQREFSQLIKQYDAQVFKHGYLHFCGIVPKYFSSLSNRYEIFIVFLNESPSTSFIGFRVKVSKETFTYESKSLLLFLKNSEKAVFYSMNNNLIHVHCGTNAWELFYLLYDEYLKRYVLTVIGTRFFYHFVYSCCIEKEKQFLEWFYKGSRVIRVSKASIYYKIHRKRKISLTDLVCMTLNMPKRKKYTLSCFSFKESLLHSDMENSDFYTVTGNKINISKLTLKKYKKQAIVPEKCSQKIIPTDVIHKRKFHEFNVDQKLKFDKSYYSENKWKQFKNFESYRIQNYSSIPFINTLVPSLLKNKNSSCDSNLHEVKTHSNTNFPFLVASDNKGDKIKKSAVAEEACVLRYHKIKDTNEKHIEKSSLFKNESMTLGCIIPKDVLSYATSSNDNLESHSCVNNSDLTKNCDIDSIYFSTKIKDMKNEDFAIEDVNFTTATGKSISVSSAAMLKAYKLCEKDQVFSEKITSDIIKPKVPKTNNYPDSEEPASIIPKISENKYLQTFPLLKNDENISKKFTADHSSNIEDLEADSFDITEDVGFCNAAGKTITVSSTAIEAAKKLIYSVANEEKALLHNESASIKKNQFHTSEVSNNGCTSKSDDVDMDNTLVEKFFEDVHFDEKELELTGCNIMKDSLSTVLESKNEKSLPARKARKSLGGRRSMRDCSNKF